MEMTGLSLGKEKSSRNNGVVVWRCSLIHVSTFFRFFFYLSIFFSAGFISTNVDIETRIRRPRKRMCRKKVSLTFRL